jgi:exopolysaccharide production protein ExoQ
VLRNSRARSIILKVYFLYLLGVVSSAFYNIFGKRQASALSGDTVHFALFAGLLVWTLVLVYPVYESIRKLLMSRKLLLGLYLFAAISCCWAPNPFPSVREIFILLTLLISAAYVSLVFSPEEIVDLTAKVTAIFALASIPAQFMQNPMFDTLTAGWVGLYGHKNLFGVAMAIGIAALLVSRSKWSFGRWCMLLLFLVLLILAQSASAIVMAGTVVAIYAFTKLPRFARLLVPFAGAVLTVGVIWTSNVDHVKQQFFDLINRDTTLTGRNDIWHFVSGQIMDRPLLGFGYLGFWVPHEDIIIANLGWDPGHSHNGFLDVILVFGIVGLFVLLAVLWDAVKCGVRVRVSTGSLAGTWLLMVIWLEFLNNMTEVDYVQPSLLWTLFVMTYFKCSLVESEQISIGGENTERVVSREGGLLHGG